MRIIIAPAKKMVVDTDSFAVDGLPQFLEQTEQLKAVLQGMSSKDLQTLWKCNDSINNTNEGKRQMGGGGWYGEKSDRGCGGADPG